MTREPGSPIITSRNAAQISVASAGIYLTPKGGGTPIAVTVTDWKYRMLINQGW